MFINFLQKKSSSVSNAMSIVELMVHMDCDGCQRRVHRAIRKLNGVHSVDIDMDKQKVTVTGYVEEKKVIKAVRRTGRKAEFWPYPYDSEYYPFALQYLEDDFTLMGNHNYYRHGHTSAVHGYFPDPAHSVLVDDHALALFNDENVHACVVM
ncbi:heavy metal-associated isoprenylated plant protein 45-like [Zingiber officinale]|uniref:heavy metal-associated isoprenylated plant protein 45-like n=1 Tax=Zingiber officinale TaxID=94328 RepID=UPI001C4D03AE|nr:heavy metal-associated isoprenylated plant protein 45-like [Zingiber officinale]